MGVYGGIEKNWAALTNTGRTHVATKGVVQSGLVLNLDAGVSSSYCVPLTVEYLIVAGGGGGGGYYGGGGAGSGGLLSGSTTLTTQTYTVTVGAGGGGGANVASIGARGTNGGNSIFNALTAIGGGGGGAGSGGSNTYSATGNNGGSGGGGGGYNGGSPNNPGGTGTSGQGNNGGTAASSLASAYGAGGGGGASAVGSNGSSTAPGAGGAGTVSDITGSSVTYGGGGGGGSYSASSSGGSGGGGAGAGSGNGVSATANTGGGGGGSGALTPGIGGAGGSGIVIIRYLGSQVATGGIVTSAGGYTIHTFTTVGSSTFTLTWTDLSGNGNTGTLVNGVGYVGTNGGLLSFDGVDDNITTGKVLVPRTGQFHIEGWCYLNQTNINCMFVTQYNNGSDAGRFLCFFGNDGVIRMHDGNGVMTGTTPSYSANQWYYVAFQRDSSNLCNIFVNSVKQTTGDTKTTTLENTNTIIGSRGSAQSGTYFKGNISNVRIYNRALSAAEVQRNFLAMRGRFGI